MKLAQIVDVATQMVTHAQHILDDGYQIDDQNLHQYWAFSRDLSHEWMHSLSVCQKILDIGDPARHRHCWLEYEPDLRDILRADVLHRVWYSILMASDEVHQTRRSGPIARSILTAHLQTRLRCLKIVLAGHRIDASRMKHLNELRKSSELWSDFLCSHLVRKYRIDSVLFDVDRVRQWDGTSETALKVERNSLSMVGEANEWDPQLIPRLRKTASLNPLHRLAQVMLSCFPDSAFDKDDLLREF